MQGRLCTSGYFSCLIAFNDSPLVLDTTLPLNLQVSGQPIYQYHVFLTLWVA